MGAHLLNRRTLLLATGRPMQLRRQLAGGAFATVTLVAFDRAFAPGEISGGVQQGDMTVETLNDEIAAAAWPAPPRNPDRLVMDGRTYTVMGAKAVMVGTEMLGYRLWLRGS